MKEVKRLLAERFLAGNPMQMIDVVDEALRKWVKAQRGKGGA